MLCLPGAKRFAPLSTSCLFVVHILQQLGLDKIYTFVHFISNMNVFHQFETRFDNNIIDKAQIARYPSYSEQLVWFSWKRPFSYIGWGQYRLPSIPVFLRTLKMKIFLILVVCLATFAKGDITGTNPAVGSCLCFSEDTVNIRSSGRPKAMCSADEYCPTYPIRNYN